MVLPITIPLLQIEIDMVKSDTQPTTEDPYKVLLVEDLGYTKLWMVYKLIQ